MTPTGRSLLNGLEAWAPSAAPAISASIAALPNDSEALCVTCYRPAAYTTSRKVRACMGENDAVAVPACYQHALRFSMSNGLELPT